MEDFLIGMCWSSLGFLICYCVILEVPIFMWYIKLSFFLLIAIENIMVYSNVGELFTFQS